jgi:hypothetical protein
VIAIDRAGLALTALARHENRRRLDVKNPEDILVYLE